MSAISEDRISPITYTLRVTPVIPAGSVADTRIFPLACRQDAQFQKACLVELWLSLGFDVIERKNNPWVWEVSGELLGVPTRWQFEVVFETLSLN